MDKMSLFPWNGMRSDLRTMLMGIVSRSSATRGVATRGMKATFSLLGAHWLLPLLLCSSPRRILVVCVKRGREYSPVCAFMCVYLHQGLSADRLNRRDVLTSMISV